MKKIAIVALCLLAASEMLNASIVEKKQTVLPFTAINVQDPFEIVLKQGSSYATVMKLDSRVADYCRLFVEGTTLYVELNKNAFPKELKNELNKSKASLDLKVEVTVPSLNQVTLSGKAKLSTGGAYKSAGKINFELSDDASLYNADFTASTIELNAVGKALVDAKFNADDVNVSAIKSSQVSLKLSGARSSLSVNGFAKVTASTTSSENYVNIDGAGSRTTITGKAGLLSVNATSFNNVLDASALDADNVKLVAKNVTINVKALKTISFDISAMANVTFDGPAAISIVKIDGASVFSASQPDQTSK